MRAEGRAVPKIRRRVRRVAGRVPGAVGRKHLVAEYCEDTQLLRVDSTLDPEFWVEVRIWAEDVRVRGRVRGCRGNLHFVGSFDTESKVVRVDSTANDEFWLEVQFD